MTDALATSPPTTALPSVHAPAVRAIRVEVVAGPDAGTYSTNASDRIAIGTHRTADLVLTDRTVSRFHLELVSDGDAVVLRDLGSRNGTLLDGVELVHARLRGPAIVTIGQTELRIDLHGEPVPLALAAQEKFGQLLGTSPVMRRVFAQLGQVVLRDGHVLVEGERGTGKDLAAAALHELGTRRDGPLDAIDCAGPPLDVEAALLGRGDRPSVLERCHGGTLVLDEIGALPRATQRALVRALDERSLRRRDAIMPTDVRVIALSRRNLRVDVNADRFVPELFELLAGTRIRLPPLRERPEDIPLLVASFVAAHGATQTREGVQLLAAESIEQLRAAVWPGNVRELQTYVEHVLLAQGAPLPDDVVPPLVDGGATLRDARRRWLAYFERAYVAELLARTGGKVNAAAVLAGVDRVYLHRMITRCGLRDLLAKSRDQ